MSAVTRIAAGLWDFVVGDDWVTAAGVAAAIGVAAVLQGLGIEAWWVIPAGVLVLLAASLRRAARGDTDPA